MIFIDYHAREEKLKENCHFQFYKWKISFYSILVRENIQKINFLK